MGSGGGEFLARTTATRDRRGHHLGRHHVPLVAKAARAVAPQVANRVHLTVLQPLRFCDAEQSGTAGVGRMVAVAEQYPARPDCTRRSARDLRQRDPGKRAVLE
jgi:hypothetical protein